MGGVALAAIGLWYDDYDYQSPNASPVTNYLKNVLQYSTGVEKNDTTFKEASHMYKHLGGGLLSTKPYS